MIENNSFFEASDGLSKSVGYMRHMSIRLFPIILFLFIFSIGCKPRLIPNTSVPDTEFNEAVTDFMVFYKRALESRNIDSVLKLVAKDYHQPASEGSREKGYGYAQLEDKLKEAFAHIQELNIGIHIQHIYAETHLVEVVYYFTQQALIEMPTGEQWSNLNDVNRITLRQKGSKLEDGFEIISGL